MIVNVPKYLSGLLKEHVNCGAVAERLRRRSREQRSDHERPQVSTSEFD